MKLYEIDVIIKSKEWKEKYDSRELFSAYTDDIFANTQSFNKTLGSADFICISGTMAGQAQLSAIVTSKQKIEKIVSDFFGKLGIEFDRKRVVINEVTFDELSHNLRRADRINTIEGWDDVLDRFEIRPLSRGSFRNELDWGENIITDFSKEDILDASKKLFTNQTLIPEIERIYESQRCGAFLGHPVHYIVETDNHDARKETCRNLLRALYNCKRIENRRYCYMDIDDGMYSDNTVKAVYRSCVGGAVLVRFPYDAEGETDVADTFREAIEPVAKIVTEFKNKVLTVFCVPKNGKNIKSLLNEYLGNISYVEITEVPAENEDARLYLSYLARENNIRPDRKLYSKLEENTGYFTPELIQMFDAWHNEKLRNTYYPQYGNAKTTKQTVAKEKAKGFAYDELMEMIGIDSAKRVINQALDFYKAKKLFGDKGFDSELGAMHMVFTGNPGTAKTTVARLLARIMKENNILPKGHLVECGRADLVGKYVGWTAPTIKEKFKRAKGGVLFIDEAYSLVEDRGGSFGDEAINTIVQEMENNRDDVIVIFAGYPDKMEQFIQKNPGLRSRIAFHVNFEDYSAADLCDIARLMAKKKSLILPKETCDKLEKIFEEARRQGDFGNGRYVRNILEKAKLAQASRLVKCDYEQISHEDIRTICPEDIEAPSIGGNNKRAIGFC